MKKYAKIIFYLIQRNTRTFSIANKFMVKLLPTNDDLAMNVFLSMTDVTK